MALSALFIAGSFVVGGAIARDLDPRVLTLMRFVLAAFCLVPLAARHRLTWPGFSDLGRYALISASYVAFFVLMFEALKTTTALKTSALFTLVPGLSAMFGAVMVGERLGLNRLGALVLCAIGALWVIFEGDAGKLRVFDVTRGDGIFLLGCVSMALYSPLMKRFTPDKPMLVSSFWVIVTGSLWLVPFAVVPAAATDWQAVPADVYWGVLYLAVFATAATVMIFLSATPKIGPTRVAAYSYLYPVLVAAIGASLGQGLPPAAEWPGIALILVAMAVVQSAPRRAGPLAPPGGF